MTSPSSTLPIPNTRRGIFRATVLSNFRLCRDHFLLRLSLPFFPPSNAGQFVQILCREPDADLSEQVRYWPDDHTPTLRGIENQDRVAILRRPFSLAGRIDHTHGDSTSSTPTRTSVELHLVHRVVGSGTSYLASLRQDDPLEILGPLGNTFPTPPDPQTPILLVGGGVGIPPMIYAAQMLADRSTPATAPAVPPAPAGPPLPASPRIPADPRSPAGSHVPAGPVIAFCGSLSHDLLSLTPTPDAPKPTSATCIEPLLSFAEFARHNVPTIVATDDGSYGFKGYITQALTAYLEKNLQAFGQHKPIIFTCGPEIMEKTVANIAAHHGLTCYAAVERAMACGMGTCQSCCIKVKSPTSPDAWKYALACTQGPVMDTSTLLW